MQGKWVGQSEMTLTGPSVIEKKSRHSGWTMEMENQWMGVGRAVKRK